MQTSPQSDPRSAAALHAPSSPTYLYALKRSAWFVVGLCIAFRGVAVARDTDEQKPEVPASSLAAFADGEAPVDPPRLFRLAFSGDGSYLIAGGDAVRVFRVETGEPVQRIPTDGSTNALAVFPGRGGRFAASGEDGVICIRRIYEKEAVRELRGHTGTGRHLAISPDGKLIASVAGQLNGGSWTRSELRLWDAATGRVLHELNFDPGNVGCVVFSQNGKQLALAMNSVGAEDVSHVDVYDVTSRNRLHSVTFSPGFADSICFRGDTGELLIIGGDCPTVGNGCRPTGRIWFAARDSDNARGLKQDREYSYFAGTLTPAADRFVIGTSTATATVNAKGKVDGSRMGPLVQLRDAKTGGIVWSTITAGAGDPDGIAVSPDGRLIAALIEQTIHLFDIETGERVRDIRVEK